MVGCEVIGMKGEGVREGKGASPCTWRDPMWLIIVEDPLSNARRGEVYVVAILGGEASKVGVNKSLCVVSGKVTPSALVDESVRIEWVMSEDPPVGDCGGRGEEAGEVAGDCSVMCGEEVVLAHKDEADALSVLRNVDVCMLFVECDVIVHDTCGLMDVCNKISVV